MNETTAVAARPWLKWSWRHYHPHVEMFDSLDQAVAAACWASEDGDEAYHCIETPEGGIIDKARMGELMSAHWDAERLAEAANPEPVRTHGIKLQMPGERDAAWYGSYTSEAERDAVAAPLVERFGDRVLLGRVPWPNGR